jgi:1,2-diacylglycerol 3-alpha-glucosyltransferase
MRIGIFSESYEPLKNGVAISVRTLIDELRAARHHVCVVAPHFPDYIDDSPFVMRVPSILSPVNADYPVPYPWFPRLRRQLAKLQLDILHSHSPWFLGLLAVRAARRQNIPHVSTYHTLYENYAHYLSILPEHATRGLIEWWMPEFYNQCTCVIAPSKVAAQSLRGYGVTSKIAIIPTGSPLPYPEHLSETSVRVTRQRWGVPLDSPVLLYVGRIAREKNLELVLESFALVSRTHADARLMIVGDGPYLEDFRTLAAASPCGGRIIFTGPIDRSELDPIYAAADLFVFGSCTETQGLVVAEARAAGTPAVVSRVGGASENVTDGEDGLIVEPSPEAFSRAISAVLENTNRRIEMRQRCRHNAQLQTPAAMALRVAGVYREAVDATSESMAVAARG